MPNANDTRPSNPKIADAVRGILAGFAKRDPGSLQDTAELAKHLRIPESSMVHLTLSLRGYIKHFNSAATIRVKEVRKKKQTVSGIVTIVQGRI